MKSFISILLIAITCVFLSACGSNFEDENDDSYKYSHKDNTKKSERLDNNIKNFFNGLLESETTESETFSENIYFENSSLEGIDDDVVDVMTIFEENFNNNFSQQLSELNTQTYNNFVPPEEYNKIKMSTTSDVITEGHFAYIRCYNSIYRFDDRTKTFNYVMELDKSNLSNWLVAENWIYYVTDKGVLKRKSVDGTTEEIIEDSTTEYDKTTFCFNNGLHYIKEYYDFVSGIHEYWLVKLDENMNKIKLSYIDDRNCERNIYFIDSNGNILLQNFTQLYTYNPSNNILVSITDNCSTINNYFFENFRGFEIFKTNLELYSDLNQFFEYNNGIIISNHSKNTDPGVFLYTADGNESKLFREVEVQGVTKDGYMFINYRYLYDINTQTAYEYDPENNILSTI